MVGFQEALGGPRHVLPSSPGETEILCARDNGWKEPEAGKAEVAPGPGGHIPREFLPQP